MLRSMDPSGHFIHDSKIVDKLCPKDSCDLMDFTGGEENQK